MDQAHLAPLPLNVRPVHWDYEDALSLHPVPDVVILNFFLIHIGNAG